MTANTSTLIIQDDVWDGSLHLDEVLLSAISAAEGGAAAFAFVTKDGLNAVFGSEEFGEFCRAGHHFDLYIGIDSVTNDETLRFAKKLASDLHGKLNVKVYCNAENPSIFHAKTTWFRNPGGDGCMAFVGSGNLTRAGLQKNVEMFSWIEQDKKTFNETMSTWNGWIDAAGRAGCIYDIDDEAMLARAKDNIWKRDISAGTRAGQDDDAGVTGAVLGEEAILVSKMPKQTGRGWGQYVMSKRFFEDFFGFEIIETNGVKKAASKRRVLLRSVGAHGELGELESRAGNISSNNSNYRIELDAGHGLDKDDLDTHMIVFAKTGSREYLYQIMDSSSPYCDGLLRFAEEHRSDKKGDAKCLVSAELFARDFPECPIVQALKD